MLNEFSNDLKTIRESKGITLAEISAQTRINIKFLANIENGKFDFQPDTYIKSFLREYARCIDISEILIITEFDKAKAGYYPKKNLIKITQEKITNELIGDTSKPVNERAEPVRETFTSKKAEPQQYFPQFRKDEPKTEIDSKYKKLTQKIILGIAGIAILIGIIYLIIYLYDTQKGNTNQVKEKSFEEIAKEYENKLKDKNIPDSISRKEDSLASVSDSLLLTIVTSKDTRVKIYIDEKEVIETEIPADDTLNVKAKENFRFSSSANSSVYFYLNGKYLKKPKNLTEPTIKNLVINKDGFQTQ